MAKYFGTNGIRGKFDTLTPQFALRCAQAIGIYFTRGKVLVGMDHRLTSPVLHKAVLAGLQSVGCEVVDLGLASAPTAEFMIQKTKADGLIIITASHNPPEWNALKVVDGKGVAISKERGEEIEKLIDGKIELAGWDKVKEVEEYEDAVGEHLKAILKSVNVEKIRKRKLKVVLDCANGTPALIGPRLFRELGCEVILLNEKVDGHFPGRPSEPREENVQQMLKTVLEKKADLGIAWDGDGDRVIMADENGQFIVGDRVYALSVLLKLNEKKGKVVTTVATSKAVEDVAGKFGQEVVYTKVGAPYLSEEMAKGKAVIGGEEVGGVIWPEVSLAKDGFLTAAKIAEALTEKKMGAWMKEFPFYHIVKGKISGDPKKIMNKMNSLPLPKDAEKVIKIDGIRINFKDSWVIVRPSGTEPLVRIFAESTDENKAKRLVEEYEKKLKG